MTIENVDRSHVSDPSSDRPDLSPDPSDRSRELSDPSRESSGGARLVLPGGGGWLRIMLAIAALLTMFELWVPGQAGGQIFLQLIVMAVIGVWVVVRPGSAAPAVLLIGAVCLRVFIGHPQLDGSLIDLAALLPLVHQLAALSAVVPVRSNVQLAALLPTAARYLGAVLATVLGLIISHLLGWW